jgi:hypothetical protein
MPRPLKPPNPYASWSALFGATVQKLRLSLRARPVVTQDELGKLVHAADSTVSAIERGVLRPSESFVEKCEQVLPSGGMLRAMLPFVSAEWDDWERHGGRPPTTAVLPPTTAVLPPSEIIIAPEQLADVGSPEAAVNGAFEVMELARQAEASSIGTGTLEGLDRAVDRLCRAYPSSSPHILAPSVQQRLRYARRLLDGKLTLSQHRQLLVASGWLAALLACLQFDIGDREAAEASRDMAFQLGREAGHQEVVAWSFELLAWFALVDHRFQDTVEFARTGLQWAANASAGVQLTVQEAKAWSRLGNRREAEDAMRRGATILAKLPVPAHPEHHFVFDASKLSFYAATCYTWLGEADRAEEHARQVVAQCLEVPGQVRWPTRLAENRVDLGLIAARRGQPDEAAHLGSQALSSERKSGSTLDRVAELDALLMRDYADVPDAQDLHEHYVTARRVLTQGTIS